MAATAPRSDARALNYGSGPPDDGLKRDWDICPTCGQPRWQLIIVPDRFHCDRCEKAGPRNNKPPPEPEPEQMGLALAPENMTAEYDRPPIDEADAWMADEMPDE